MKLSFSLILAVCTVTVQAQGAHSYYDELRRAGGLDKRASEYACFDDDKELKTFFTYDESARIKAFFQKTGEWAHMSIASKVEIEKGFVSIRQYDHGVPLGDLDFYMRDGASFVSEERMLDSKTPVRVRYTVAPSTLRYKKTVELLNAKSHIRSQLERYGRCEVVADEQTETK